MNSSILLIIGILVTAFALVVSWMQGRRSASAVILGVGLLLFIIDAVLGSMSIHAGSIDLARRWEHIRLVATIPTTIVWLWFSFSSFTGAASEKGRKFWFLLTITGTILAVIGGFLPPGLIIDNVISQERDRLLFHLNKPALVLPVAALVGATAVLMNLERALRASSGINRWKMKFTLLGIGVLFVVRIYTNTQAIVYGTIDSALDLYINGSLIVGPALILVSLFRSKSSIATIYPSQEIIYKSFTLLLVGLYVLIVGLLAEIVTFFGGVAAFPLKAFCLLLATVGLAALFLSERVRYRSRQWISRHFKRPMYDFRQVWTTVSARTASALDEFELCRVATRIVSETLQVLSASIWLVPASRSGLVLGASTSLSANAAQLTGAEGELSATLEQLRKSEGPINIDQSKAQWVEPLKRCNPDQFREAGDRICVPIRAGDELLGFIMVGDRVTGVSLSVEDCDLLKCICDQLGRDILNGRLSRRVAEAKEFQAFQTMATFFVHDLKNTAWTLSLMLQNLRSHFDDPKFREDALKAVGQSVTRMNELISRLTALREGLQLNCAATDLNNLVESAVKEFTQSAVFSIRQEYRPLPQLSLDAEQIKKVVTNLVLNAGDALRGPGEIQIETTRADGWAILSVKDNGCGMTAEFMQRQLFRPFQTTKKKGIGIGMFQSKMIVEAHQGKIEVESAEGKGSTFRVFLPIPAQGGE